MKNKKSLAYRIISVSILISLFVLTEIGLTAQPGKTADRKLLLERSTEFMYQIQGLRRRGAINALSKTDYLMLIVEPTFTIKGDSDFNAKNMLRRLRKTPDGKRRVILAYIDIGEAEDYRTYWKNNWQAPSGGQPGNPSFILTPDPDGWSGNYVVAFWHKRWRDIWVSRRGLVRRLAKLGFDGVYLDWVEAYSDDEVRRTAKRAKIRPARRMVAFIREIRNAGRSVRPNFLVVAQNAPYLINLDPGYARAIDGLAVEDTWYRGEADVSWNSPSGGDIKNRYKDKYSTVRLLNQYKKYLKVGLPVFTIDYCLKQKNADRVYRLSRERGLRPLVTRSSLAKITRTPP